MPSSSSSNDLFAFLIYESLLCGNNIDSITIDNITHPFKFSSMLEDHLQLFDYHNPTMDSIMSVSQPPPTSCCSLDKPKMRVQANPLGVVVQQQGSKVVRKRRRRRPKTCKNKEEAETQRMTHIFVERNRRRQMNDHLTELRSLMPDSYIQRGDQASIIGGAIDYVKELEHRLQFFQAQKLKQDLMRRGQGVEVTTTAAEKLFIEQNPFSEFFSYPQYTWCLTQSSHNNKRAKPSVVADIEVTLTESHAKVRILTKRHPRKLSRVVAAFQLLNLSVHHLSITSLESLVLYSISAKVEEGCQLRSSDDIADATHHMLTRISEETAAVC